MIGTTGEGTAPEAPVEELGPDMRTAIARLYRRMRAERPHGDLGDAAMTVLLLLDRHGAHTLKALSDHERVTPGSMSQVVNRLAAGGYVERRADPDDGRRVLFTVTPTGHSLAVDDRTRRHTWFDAALQELDDRDRAVLADAARILHRIASH